MKDNLLMMIQLNLREVLLHNAGGVVHISAESAMKMDTTRVHVH